MLGVLFGAVIGLGAIAGLAALDLRLFAWPAFDWRDPQAWSRMIADAPMHAQAMLAGSGAIGALAGGLIGVRIAAWPAAGWIVTLLIALAGGLSVLLVPQPLWMQICAIAAPLVAGLVVSGASGAA